MASGPYWWMELILQKSVETRSRPNWARATRRSRLSVYNNGLFALDYAQAFPTVVRPLRILAQGGANRAEKCRKLEKSRDSPIQGNALAPAEVAYKFNSE